MKKYKAKNLTDKQKNRKERLRPAFALFFSGSICLAVSILNLKEIFQSTKLNIIALSFVVLVLGFNFFNIFSFDLEKLIKVFFVLISTAIFAFGLWIEPFGLGSAFSKEFIISQELSIVLSIISCWLCALALFVGFVYFCMGCFSSNYCKNCGTELRKVGSQKYGDSRIVEGSTSPTSIKIESVSSDRVTYSVSGGETKRKEVQKYMSTWSCPKCGRQKQFFHNEERKL